ncbi:amidohydrolase family protein [Streptomyces sp. NPDC051913]|uniref:amidohydrolase family protein n=1 Tax=Streptomyces sp. NPDC051913 TaxID=3365676 RepID=UPI0037CD5BAF
MTTGTLIRRAELDGDATADVRIEDGIVSEIAARLTPRRAEEVLDARGGALLPGLCDHHLHLHAMAAADHSARCGPPDVRDPAGLAAALARTPPDERGWIRGVGYAEEVAGPLDARSLDRLYADGPVRVQHRSGALWVVNTAGARSLGLEDASHPGVERDDRGRPTGRLWRADDWLRTRWSTSRPPDLRAVGARLARWGVTHVTDATPDLDLVAVDAVGEAMRTGALPQHVQLLGAPLGWTPPGNPRAPTAGPYKIVLADSGLPGLDVLIERVRAVHDAARPIAVHCVSREALILVVLALECAGPRAGDRLEHAALVPAELLPRLRELGLTVVTQPGFLAHRGDAYARDIPAAEHPDLYRARTLIDGGTPLALSSDAPYGPADPWAVIAAAMRRDTPSGRTVGAVERLTGRQALDACLGAPQAPGGPPRRVAPGTRADLILLEAPLVEALARPSAGLVTATWMEGVKVWDANIGM